MKRCSQCYQTYSDENLFCLSDGAELVPISNTSSEATVITSSPYFRQPSPPSIPIRQGINLLFIYVGIGLLALVIGGGLVMWNNKTESTASQASNSREEDLKRREQELVSAFAEE